MAVPQPPQNAPDPAGLPQFPQNLLTGVGVGTAAGSEIAGAGTAARTGSAGSANGPLGGEASGNDSDPAVAEGSVPAERPPGNPAWAIVASSRARRSRNFDRSTVLSGSNSSSAAAVADAPAPQVPQRLAPRVSDPHESQYIAP